MDATYSPPVDRLLTFGGEPAGAREWPDYVEELKLSAEHAPELIRMATDEDLNWADSESTEVWAPIHAWRALGQLRAEAAIDPLIPLFHELEESEWTLEEMPKVFGMIGQAAVPALKRYLSDRSHGLWARVTAVVSLQKIGAAEPEVRAECVAALTYELDHHWRNDPTLNALLIAELMELNATEAAPSMERAFAGDDVDLSVAGDWEDVQVELGLLEERQTPRPPIHFFPEVRAAARAAKDASRREADLRRHDAKAKTKAKSRRKMAKQSRKRSHRRK